MSDFTVIHTISSLWKCSGATDAAINAAIGAAKLNHNVIIITWSNDESICLLGLDKNISVLAIDRKSNFLHNIFKFKKILLREIISLRKSKQKIVMHDHGCWEESNIASAWVAKLNSITLVTSPHGMLEPWALANAAFKKKIAWLIYQKKILQIAKRIHVTALPEKTSVANILPTAQIDIVPLGTKIFPQFSKCETKTALFLSRIHPKKGIDLLLDSWAEIAPADWKLLITGPNEADYADVVKNRIEELGVSRSVKLLDAVYDEEKQTLFSRASLFILPSYSENFGLVVAEAMVAGLPVITTNKTPWLDLDVRGCGWTVSPDKLELQEAIKSATEISAKQRFTMGQTGRAWMVDQFSTDKYGDDMVTLYRDILKNDRHCSQQDPASGCTP